MENKTTFSGCTVNTSGSLVDILDNSVVSASVVNTSFLNHLGRGGNFQYYWSDPQELPVWFVSGSPPSIPDWDATYFSVNPSIEKLDGYSRGKLENISGINCLYGDFDMKDGKTMGDIERLEPPPSVIIDSGGGWHCYWLLADTLILNPENTQRIKELEAQWVNYIDSDPGAKDLTRVLRVPGSYNNKYEDPKEVKYLKAELSLLYFS